MTKVIAWWIENPLRLTCATFHHSISPQTLYFFLSWTRRVFSIDLQPILLSLMEKIAEGIILRRVGWRDRPSEQAVWFSGQTHHRPPDPACRGVRHKRLQETTNAISLEVWYFWHFYTRCSLSWSRLTPWKDASLPTEQMRTLTTGILQSSLPFSALFRDLSMTLNTKFALYVHITVLASFVKRRAIFVDTDSRARKLVSNLADKSQHR